MASTLKVDQIETPSGVGSISFAQPISGDGSQLTGVGLNIASVAAGDVLYYNGTAWARLPKGTAAQVLKMNAGATAPEWGADATGSGGISEPASSAAGDILYYDGTEYTRLAKGTAGQQLAINAGATAPEWITPSGGKVLQMVHTTTTFGSTTASASDNTYVDSSVTITFTPTTTASKFIVYFGIGAVVVAEPDDGGYDFRVKKVQSSTASYPAFLSDFAGSGNHHGRRYFYDDALTNINNWHAYDTFTGVDADAHTTAAITYTVQFAGFNVGTTLSVGDVYSARSQMIVQEIAN